MTSIMDHGNQSETTDLINQQISLKVHYLAELQAAVKAHDDRKIFALLDNQRYAAEILHTENNENETAVINLVDDLSEQLSSYLSTKLIKYLGQTYPFFYYEEFSKGHFRILFGNWWDRREFGELDVLNIRFVFNDEEYHKLSQSFELNNENKRFNSDQIQTISEQNDELQTLIDNQDQRQQQKDELQAQLKETVGKSGMPWESGKQKEARQEIVDQLSVLEDQDERGRNASKQIKTNEELILTLSKENTILSYEQKSIVDTFTTFENFEAANRNLYADYLNYLAQEKQVEAND